jgi:hypothetical protein
MNRLQQASIELVLACAFRHSVEEQLAARHPADVFHAGPVKLSTAVEKPDRGLSP